MVPDDVILALLNGSFDGHRWRHSSAYSRHLALLQYVVLAFLYDVIVMPLRFILLVILNNVIMVVLNDVILVVLNASL